ncbi:MAG: orotidine-5'-phosphate decarboxylase [Acidimicrobiales bacterium]
MGDVTSSEASTGAEGFASRVARAVADTGPLCAGIDPSVGLLGEWGLPASADGVRTFGLRCIEAFAGVVPVVKPQVAFFERWGSAGMAALEDVLAAGRAAGLLVIADAKRGDIGSTMEAYASAWLDPMSPLVADAVTATPYLGLGALQPALDLAAASGRGVIVVVRSSNPEGRSLQEARTSSLQDGSSDGPSVEDMLLAAIAECNHGGLAVPGTVGAVVGATREPSAFDLAGLGGVILAPGLGAQGGTAASAAALFGGCPRGSVLPSASRSILGAGPDVAGLREAARAECQALGDVLN